MRGRPCNFRRKKPDKGSLTTNEYAGVSASIWYDGSKLTFWRRSMNEFMALEFAGDTNKLLDELTDKYKFEIPLADLLYSDVSKALAKTATRSRLRADGADWQLWVEAGSTLVPRRFADNLADATTSMPVNKPAITDQV
ncbi:DUF2092 domain-containing protein [Mesorhizobium onobrychidis]|uniref:DUF2092 domain-containing protein n=1 Tax=Mesorhizobium onobrychidis TaxID=2775404 RepID=UPI0021572DCD|nr:DUF2092 domain-containing protein [Mesorhizobium onobrychidis]